MKTSTLLVSLLVLLGSATSTYAGPGAQYWQQRRNPPTNTEKTSSTDSQKTPAKDEANTNKCDMATGTCTCCKKS